MCGLVGFVGSQPDLGLLTLLFQQARRRGPDALGLVWATGTTLRAWHTLTLPGHPVTLPLPRQTSLLLGHARLSTSGTGGLADAQPLLLDSQHAFAHNGTVYQHALLAAQHELVCQTTCDSEVLGRLWEHTQHDVEHTMTLLTQHQHSTRHAWIAATPTTLTLVPWGQPLAMCVRPEGQYVCSRAFPGSTWVIPYTVLGWSSTSWDGRYNTSK